MEVADFDDGDRALAEQSLRRLEQPLRLTVFGTDPRHAISLLNLMIGQPVMPSSLPRARATFLHGEESHARLTFQDGTRKRLEGSEFRKLFDGNPAWVRVHVDLPVLRKISLMVATDRNPNALCADIERTLYSTDFALWAGDELCTPVHQAWRSVPDRLRDHSYLVLSPAMDDGSWTTIRGEFVDVLTVDPRRAQEAKARKDGVDKAAFKAAGGTELVATIKKEIDLLVQSALDAAEVLLLRHASDADAEGKESVAEETPDPGQFDTTTPPPEDVLPSTHGTRREKAFSVPLGKVASRSRMLESRSQDGSTQITKHTVAKAMKNMPRSRQVSKTGPKPRVKSRKSRPATPWSLDL